MPPSGFSTNATSALVSFVKDCIKDLEEEVKQEKHASLKLGLSFEIEQIEKALSSETHVLDTAVVFPILEFVLAIYKEMGTSLNRDGDLVLFFQHFEEQSLAMHIDAAGKLTIK